MNILLTGATRGLGLEICGTLLARGDTVFAVGRVKSEGLSELESKFGDRLRFKSVDLSDAKAVKGEIYSADFISYETVLDGFVNNAAIAYDDILTNANLTKLREMFEVNVYSPIMIAKYAVRNMLLHGTSGSIVHISSVSTRTGYKGLSMYAASKGALEAFSKNTAREWGGRRIRSNVVSAGFMNTNMSAALTEAQRDRIYARTSLKAETDKASVAATVAFLLSNDSYSITGTVIPVDCGTV